MTLNIGTVMVFAGFWLLTAFLFAILCGKFFKKRREKEDLYVAVKCIRKFLGRDPDAPYFVYRRKADGVMCSEEVVGKPDLCVICKGWGVEEAEDARQPLQVIADCYIPLCADHKEFVKQHEEYIEKEVADDEWFENAPSE